MPFSKQANVSFVTNLDYWTSGSKQITQTTLALAAQVNTENLNPKNEYFLNSVELHPSGMSLALGYAYEDPSKLTQSSFIVGVSLSQKGGSTTVNLKPSWSFNVIVG